MHFKKVETEQYELIKGWLEQEYVAKWFYGLGLENTLKDLKASEPFWKHWIAYDEDIPFGYLMTSDVKKPTDELSQWCSKEGKAITLDLLIGNPDYLGKGLAHQMIQQLLIQKFPDVAEVLIDPSVDNKHAIHVYEKAGFEILGEFTTSYDQTQAYMMRLDMLKLS